MNVRIRVLGAVELAAANGAPTLLRWPRVRRLLAVLLVHAGEVVSVHRLGDALWGADAPADRTSAVHNLVSRLRAALRSAGAGDTVRVVTRAPGYVLEVDATAVDSIRFAGLVETARNRLDEAPQVAAALLDEALALWHGSAFGEFADDEFARPEASRLEELRQEAAGDRVDAAVALGRNDEAVGMLEPLLAADPLRERPRRQLMRALHRAGRSVEALQVYRDYRERLNAELGLDPSPELRELQAAIIRRDPGIGWIAPSSPPTNLPQPRGDLVGRAEDVIQVVDALRRARLVTLTGVGGVGKTRLALHVAAEVTAEHPDGVWLCELVALGEEAVAEGVAAVLGVRPRHELTMTARLVEYLREKRLLIVLDNCEHVTAAAGRLVDALLRGCPRVQVLATSREPLDVDGERVLPVAPLATPPRVAGGPEAVAEVASVALFVQRASAASPSFALTADNSADVAEVCRQLDGLPLALELVAPKVRTLTAAEIAARLDSRLHFVRTAGRIREQRHRTLRAAVDWSYQLLDEQQREVFDRLSVFVGSFTLHGAERVAGSNLDPAETVDVLSALVDRSLLGAQRADRPGTRCSRRCGTTGWNASALGGGGRPPGETTRPITSSWRRRRPSGSPVAIRDGGSRRWTTIWTTCVPPTAGRWRTSRTLPCACPRRCSGTWSRGCSRRRRCGRSGPSPPARRHIRCGPSSRPWPRSAPPSGAIWAAPSSTRGARSRSAQSTTRRQEGSPLAWPATGARRRVDGQDHPHIMS